MLFCIFMGKGELTNSKTGNYVLFSAHLLYRQGRCDVNARNNNGATAADLAVSAEHVSVLKLLVDHDAHILSAADRKKLENFTDSTTSVSQARIDTSKVQHGCQEVIFISK